MNLEYHIQWEDFWNKEIKSRWPKWRPEPAAFEDWFKRFQGLSLQKLADAAYRLKMLRQAKRPTAAGLLGEYRQAEKPAEPPQQTKPGNFNAAKRIVWLKKYRTKSAGILAELDGYQAFVGDVEERIEERISIATDGKTDKELAAEYIEAGLHPKHAENKLNKRLRTIREAALEAINEELNEAINED